MASSEMTRDQDLRDSVAGITGDYCKWTRRSRYKVGLEEEALLPPEISAAIKATFPPTGFFIGVALHLDGSDDTIAALSEEVNITTIDAGVTAVVAILASPF